MIISEIYKAIGAGEKFELLDEKTGQWFGVKIHVVTMVVDQYCEIFSSKMSDDVRVLRLKPKFAWQIPSVKIFNSYEVSVEDDYVKVKFQQNSDRDAFYCAVVENIVSVKA